MRCERIPAPLYRLTIDENITTAFDCGCSGFRAVTRIQITLPGCIRHVSTVLKIANLLANKPIHGFVALHSRADNPSSLVGFMA